MDRIGMVGLGVMGAGMAGNLLAKGFALSVFARDASRARPFEERGARRADTPAGLAAECGVLVLCVSDAAAVEHVLFGERGAASQSGALHTVIDCSTIGADEARAFAQRLDALGIAFLDAPVSGGQKGAAEGTLTCMVGGPQAAFDACLPVLQAMARTVTRIGDSGAGQVCKACNQIGVLANLLGVAEIVAVCERNGVDPALVRSVLLGGTSRSAALEVHALRLIERNFVPGFKAELMLKDLRLARALEQGSGVEPRITALAEPLLARLVEDGQGGLDWTAIAAPK